MRSKKINTQKGNALFLILIAVALFAALSYAVTQSGRSGDGVDKETNTINATKIIEYMGDLQYTIQRLKLVDGITDSNIQFYVTASYPIHCTTGNNCLFSRDGGNIGGGNPGTTGGNVIPFGIPADWMYLEVGDGFSIDQIGTVLPDVFGTIKNLSQNMCEEFNKKHNLTLPVPADATVDGIMNGYPGKAFACINSTEFGGYVYYHSFIER